MEQTLISATLSLVLSIIVTKNLTNVISVDCLYFSSNVMWHLQYDYKFCGVLVEIERISFDSVLQQKQSGSQ